MSHQLDQLCTDLQSVMKEEIEGHKAAVDAVKNALGVTFFHGDTGLVNEIADHYEEGGDPTTAAYLRIAAEFQGGDLLDEAPWIPDVELPPMGSAKRRLLQLENMISQGKVTLPGLMDIASRLPGPALAHLQRLEIERAAQ